MQPVSKPLKKHKQSNARPSVALAKPKQPASFGTPRSQDPVSQRGTRISVEHSTVDEGHAGQRIDNFLLGKLKGVPKSHIYRILRSGEVRVNKGRIDQTYRLLLGDVVRIPPLRMDEKKNTNAVKSFQAKMPQSARSNWSFIFEDDALLAVDKPAGMAVHGGSGISLGLIEALRLQRPEAKFLELVHRLDRETSGVLLLAKKRSALTAMHAMLRGETLARIEKHYFALVQGSWPDQRRSVRIKLSKYVTKSGERRVTVDEEDGQESHTIFTRVEQMAGCTLLDCDIRTGRTHQIRVHLASLGFPIIGDDKYGDFALNKHVAAIKNGGLKRMFLHAQSMTFNHPLTGEKMCVEAPMPKDLRHYLDFRKA
ncbi:MAG: RluA family pseudouridine synthase [Pseudomonadota bacterium]